MSAPSPLTPTIETLALICFGACLGAVARFMVYTWMSAHTAPYIATLTVNLLGSFFIGLLFVAFSELPSPRLQYLFITGLLASFTTFSTFSLDALKLFLDGKAWLAITHITGQVILGVSFCFLGVKIGQKLLQRIL